MGDAEKIEQAAQNYDAEHCDMYCNGKETFKAGVAWRDQNPKPPAEGGVTYSVDMGSPGGDKSVLCARYPNGLMKFYELRDLDSPKPPAASDEFPRVDFLKFITSRVPAQITATESKLRDYLEPSAMWGYNRGLAARANPPAVSDEKLRLQQFRTDWNANGVRTSRPAEGDEKLRDELSDLTNPFVLENGWGQETYSKAFAKGWNAARANPDPRVAELVELISQMRPQWIHSWAREKCFEVLRQNGREHEAKFDLSTKGKS